MKSNLFRSIHDRLEFDFRRFVVGSFLCTDLQSFKIMKESHVGSLRNYIENVAIVGAFGNMGTYITGALLRTDIHKTTALTRAQSRNPSKVPAAVEVEEVDYDDQASLIKALKGKDCLVILMSVYAPPDSDEKLIRAAAEAGVPWILPSEWAGDPTQVELSKDIFVGPKKQANRDLIERLGKSSWISMVAGFWYEFSIAGDPSRFGFDFSNRIVTLYGQGKDIINVSTYDQCARAVASLLSLKICPERRTPEEPTLSQFKNKFVYISSFAVSQREMFESVLRVTKASEKDWMTQYEDHNERGDRGVARYERGEPIGYIEALYVRMFYPGGEGHYEARGLLHNDVLGLPKEDLDECTRRAIELRDGGAIPY